MSQIGTNLTASVAQSAIQSQQAARARDAQQGQAGRDAKRVQDKFESHIQGFEDSAEMESPAHLHIDSHVPEHSSQQETPERQPQKGRKQPPQDPGPPAAPPVPQAVVASDADSPLYRHVDIKI